MAVKPKNSIIARGIRVHNLKNIDVEIPLKKLVVVSGVSGSGKSSLVFDTLFAEGQRRYVETFSTYARQFLERMDKPDVDHIEGLPPAIAIQQKNPVKSRRSTVGTATEINDYLRLLFARIGRTYCQGCGRLVESDSVTQIIGKVLTLPQGARFFVIFPIQISPKLSSQKHIAMLKEQGLVRLWVSQPFRRSNGAMEGQPAPFGGKVGDHPALGGGLAGRLVDLTEEPQFDLHSAGAVYGVVDRLVVAPAIKERLADALETAFRLGAGHLGILLVDEGKELKFSNRFYCDYCDLEYPEPTPNLFSFNSPIGACPKCQGFGNTIEIDMDLVVPDKDKTLMGGAIQPWTTPAYCHLQEELEDAAHKYNIPMDVPFNKLTKEQVRLIMEGTPNFCGISEFFGWLETKKYKMHVRVFLSKYRGYATCSQCKGSRLNPKALNVKIADTNIARISAMTLEEAHRFFEGLRLTEYEEEVAKLILHEIRKRLDYMVKIGLGYLTLDRLTRTLSGGEAQRVNLTTSLGSSLVNVLYILDEPSIGLHARDTERLIATLKRLRDLGNTLVVVEHDRDIISSADELIDLGPGAGEKGGQVVYQGSIDRLSRRNGSITGAYLTGSKSITLPSERRRPTGRAIVLKGACQNNLKNIDVSFPLNLFLCVTGVSGSGKSTLVQDTLYAALKKRMGGYRGPVGAHQGITGFSYIGGVTLVDQSPIGRTPRSNPITYVKAFDEIRRLFASTREARIRNLTPSAFSFNVAGGRCDYCQGEGYRKVEMQFLADVYVTCEKCHGKRFRRDVLDIRYRHKNIHEVLEMTVGEAMDFFHDSPALTKALRCLKDTGLGYLRLGQPATTLSGGEAQRLKLASYMTQREQEGLLFLFDEPTTGLHFDDIKKLLDCFQRLILEGHSIIVIEHNLEVIKCADYIIDLGPEGGEKGGYVVGTGKPEEMARLKDSYTGQYLRRYLK
ncbi:MAG: excinuclease ABC subunit UvrA [Candidatus Brocadiales bacterium]|nr:excinuclease ABC subunit UvrA [Candidatus Brocadiales bacterium]